MLQDVISRRKISMIGSIRNRERERESRELKKYDQIYEVILMERTVHLQLFPNPLEDFLWLIRRVIRKIKKSFTFKTL